MAGFDPIGWLVDIGLGAVSAYNKLQEQDKQRVRDLFVSGHLQTAQDATALVRLGIDLRKERDAVAEELAASLAAHALVRDERVVMSAKLAAALERIEALEMELKAVKTSRTPG